ncbi:MAG TPA: glycosyltransferase N-terminal domain-containing protein [Bacteroidales bacterium]|nr:glycosyltransferase N-terminal domain-containing protein [Bacteroidales bacterium]
MNILYNTGIYLYITAVRIASFFDLRARLWVRGRKNWREKVREKISPGDKVFWIHCASLGEFEQGRPVVEEIRRQKPGIKIVLSFFSPSGYEIRKDYPGADLVTYLPADTRRNASAFIDLIHPEAAMFVKYEFWYNYISVLHEKNVPAYLISGIFRPQQHFFRWYGSFFRKMLFRFSKIFVQDDGSLMLLKGIGIKNAEKAGDTRFDRVAEIASHARDIEKLEQFRGNEKLLLAGSSWRQDEEIVAGYINENPGRMKWVFAPHEIDDANIERLEKLFSTSVIRFSKFDIKDDARVMIIDNIGMLSSAYRYAHIAIVGGGFGKGIHNILEPACWGIPVLFGPRHEKFREAIELLKVNGGITFNSFESFKAAIDKLLSDEAFYLKSGNEASSYVNNNKGATNIILREVIDRL